MHVIRVTSKRIGKGKNAFTAYKARFGGLDIDVKLRKDAKPEYETDADGEYFVVKEENINISVNDNGYPVIWIK